MTKLRIFTFLLTAAFVIGVGYFVSLIARGYRFDSQSLNLGPRGLFVVTSVPNGAQILVDGKLESATNATISLHPGSYDIQLKKDGYLPWQKHITIEKEEVTKIDAYLFPAAPSLSSLTFTGAVKPILSPDKTKIAYGVAAPSGVAANGLQTDSDKVGIWIMDLADLPIGFSREPRKITDLDPLSLDWQWSPDSRQLLAKKDTNYYVLDISSQTFLVSLVPLTSEKLSATLSKWQQDQEKKNDENMRDIPPKLAENLKNTAFHFSPDGNKVFYTASNDVTIPNGLISPLPGSSTQKEERSIKKGNTYVYDLKEDKNFLVYSGSVTPERDLIKEASLATASAATTLATLRPAPKPAARGPQDLPSSSVLRWFPTSNHLILAESNKITIMDYDGTNQQTVYAGPYAYPYAVPFPNSSRLLVLTNLGAGESVGNLYAISLK
ncbi:MAG: PEGA domain-containing protein [Candidatus Blackburnbacteria bacterium]|nr:PEGA domain-containing protein [Candidatus Blackburnbacteria bacterium]